MGSNGEWMEITAQITFGFSDFIYSDSHSGLKSNHRGFLIGNEVDKLAKALRIWGVLAEISQSSAPGRWQCWTGCRWGAQIHSRDLVFPKNHTWLKGILLCFSSFSWERGEVWNGWRYKFGFLAGVILVELTECEMHLEEMPINTKTF